MTVCSSPGGVVGGPPAKVTAAKRALGSGFWRAAWKSSIVTPSLSLTSWA
jgi:hypothetical protein